MPLKLPSVSSGPEIAKRRETWKAFGLTGANRQECMVDVRRANKLHNKRRSRVCRVQVGTLTSKEER